ncbi:MAG: hypothetical protein ACXABY_22640 [Candidatus Thorarchaeota archaeon]|jgi:UDP-glucose 6-dehydrogenase
MINIGVLGTGYVGLVTGACLAGGENNYVTCFDIDKSKIDMLNDGQVPIYENELEAVIAQNCGAYRLYSFRTTSKRVSMVVRSSLSLLVRRQTTMVQSICGMLRVHAR